MSEKQGETLVKLKRGYRSVVKAELIGLVRTIGKSSVASSQGRRKVVHALTLFTGEVKPVGFLANLHLP
jgi:hypothetical protein